MKLWVGDVGKKKHNHKADKEHKGHKEEKALNWKRHTGLMSSETQRAIV
jgi:hypothetical protein